MTLQDALNNYTNAVWQLSDSLAESKNDNGRQKTKDLTKLSMEKLKWLIALSTIPYGKRNKNLLPEHHAEVIDAKDMTRLLTMTEKEGWDSVQLKKYIRSISAKYNKESNPVKSVKWPKGLVVMESELKRLPKEKQQQALNYIKDRLDAIK